MPSSAALRKSSTEDIDAIISASIEDLLNVDDVGQVIAESIFDYFSNEDNRETITRLKESGLCFVMDEGPKKLSATLEGMTIVISGNFNISRDEMKSLITSHGGKNSGSISKKTRYLLAGEKAGPEKLKKAEALGIEIIGENDILSIIGDTSPAEETEPTLF